MLRTPGHQPSGGLSGAPDLGIVGNSDLLDRLDEAGADRIGFTQMTELAYEPSGFNASRGRVKNPWSLDRVPGGSSSGSAAAVASGAVAVALGSDTGGSLRIPAHCCGITAWKPTYGLISTRGSMPLAPSLDTIGILARSAADLLPLVATLADLPPSQPVRSVVVLRDVAALCAPDIAKACMGLAAILSDLGMTIEQRDALTAIEAIDAHALTIMFAESARVHRARIHDPAVGAVLRRRLAKGLEVADDTLAASIEARLPRECSGRAGTRSRGGRDLPASPRSRYGTCVEGHAHIVLGLDLVLLAAANIGDEPDQAGGLADVEALHSPPQAGCSTWMARPARPERSKSARSSRQLSRFYHSINPDRVFGTHRGQWTPMEDVPVAASIWLTKR